MDIRGLAQQFITFAANETDANGNKRAAPTISSYRRAMEGFVAAVESYNGGDIAQLPEKFVETHWMQTQSTVIDKPIQLRVRMGCIKQFVQWCYTNNIPCTPLTFPKIKTPPRKPKEEKMNVEDVAALGDPMLADPVPQTNVIPMMQPQFTTYEQPTQQVPAPAPAPRQKAAPAPTATPAPARPTGSGRPANPLSGMLPSGQYKLRVRREREMDDPVWVADFPAERVAVHGALEPFLGREVAPRLSMQGLVGDVTFLVSAVGPNGTEGERARITVAIPAAQMAAPAASVAPMGVMTANPLGTDLSEQLAYHRRAQEELEDRIVKRVEQVSKPAPAQEDRRVERHSEIDDLKQMIGSLASTVRSLSDRLNEREDPRDMLAMMQPPQPAAPQLDILAVIKEVAAMNAKQAPAAPVQQQPGIMEMFNMMAQAKQMFAPAQVNIDVSPLEEQIAELRQQVAQGSKKKNDISEMLDNMRNVKELMGLMGEGTQGKAPRGLSSALGSLVDKIVNDPEPIAAAVERVLTATASVKAAATGVAPKPLPPAEAKRDPVPQQIRKTTEALIRAQGDSATVAAGFEWVTALGNNEQTKKLAERIMLMLREGKTNELTIYIRQIFTHFGYADAAPIERIQAISTTLVAQVQAANQAEDDENEGDEDGQPDLTVRVGNGRPSNVVITEESADEEEYEEEDEEELEGEEEIEEEYDDEFDDEGFTEDGDEQLEEAEEVVEAVEPAPVKSRKRSKKAEAAVEVTTPTPADEQTAVGA